MRRKIPYTPLATRLSSSARETELRLRNIFSGPKKRPPALFLALVFSACVLCGNLVSFRSAEAASPDEGIHAELWADDPMMESYASIAVPSFLTEGQQELYRRARALYQAMFGGDTIWIDWFYSAADNTPYESVELDGYFYTLAQGRYRQWEDFDAAVRSVFTNAYWDGRNSVGAEDEEPIPIYRDIGGRLGIIDLSRGAGYYYNENFPDEFRLDEQTDNSITFTLIGHYSPVWPRWNETPEERDRRRAEEYEYTLEFPIRMVLTNNGWRFDEFHSPLADEDGPPDEQSVYDGFYTDNASVPDLRTVLLGNLTFTSVDTGMTVDVNHVTDAVTFNPDFTARVARFAFLDLDQDIRRRPDVVLWLETEEGDPALAFIVLHWQGDGKVYGYTFFPRWFDRLKQDGTFSFSSSGADFGVGKLMFTAAGEGVPDDCTTWDLALQERVDDDWDNLTWYLDRVPATQADFEAYYEQYRAKEDAVWYDFTPETVRSVIS